MLLAVAPVGGFAEQGLKALCCVLLDVKERHFESQRPQDYQRLIAWALQYADEEVLQDLFIVRLRLIQNESIIGASFEQLILVSIHELAHVRRSSFLQVMPELFPYGRAKRSQFRPAALTLCPIAHKCTPAASGAT